jgi:hypothetical protein
LYPDGTLRDTVHLCDGGSCEGVEEHEHGAQVQGRGSSCEIRVRTLPNPGELFCSIMLLLFVFRVPTSLGFTTEVRKVMRLF